MSPRELGSVQCLDRGQGHLEHAWVQPSCRHRRCWDGWRLPRRSTGRASSLPRTRWWRRHVGRCRAVGVW